MHESGRIRQTKRRRFYSGCGRRVGDGRGEIYRHFILLRGPRSLAGCHSKDRAAAEGAAGRLRGDGAGDGVSNERRARIEQKGGQTKSGNLSYFSISEI